MHDDANMPPTRNRLSKSRLTAFRQCEVDDTSSAESAFEMGLRRPYSLYIFALSLPDTTEAPHFKYTSFRVAGKIFATAPPDEATVNIFVDEVECNKSNA